MKYNNLAKFFAVLLTVFLVFLLLSQINLEDVTKTVTAIHPVFLIAGFFLYACSNIFRTWRFYILLNSEPGFDDLFNIECVHNAINNLLPARSGELSYVYLLKKINKKNTADGVATLIIARIFDFIALIVLFFIATLLVKNIPGIIMGVLWIITVFTFTLLVILVLLLTTGQHFMKYVQRSAARIHVEENLVINFLIRKGFETVCSLDKIPVKKNIPALLVSSFLIWVLNYVVVYLLMMGMNFQISPVVVILGGTFIVLTSILPIQGIAGFGTTEAIWTLVFVPLGLSMDQAIISGFCFHIIMILYFSILGIYGAIKLKIKNFAYQSTEN